MLVMNTVLFNILIHQHSVQTLQPLVKALRVIIILMGLVINELASTGQIMDLEVVNKFSIWAEDISCITHEDSDVISHPVVNPTVE